jgi:hypothetical protein
MTDPPISEQPEACETLPGVAGIIDPATLVPPVRKPYLPQHPDWTFTADSLPMTPPLPIPVAERLPGPYDLQDGRCWWFFPETAAEFPYWNLEDDGKDREPPATHWLPYHALPLPTNA